MSKHLFYSLFRINSERCVFFKPTISFNTFSMLTLLIYLSNTGPPDTYKYMGKCDQLCHHCNARFWYDERVFRARGGPPEYHKCCNARKVRLDDRGEYPA